MRQERRVAAFAGAQVGELVGDLAVEELHRAGAGERELAALGAVDQAAAARSAPSRRASLRGVGGGHRLEDTTGSVGFHRWALADTFQQIVDALPDDWTDLELDLRIADESRYVEAPVYLVTCNANPYSHHDWHWRLLVAHRFGHAAAVPAVHCALKLLDDAGIEGSSRCARCARGAPRSCRCGAGPTPRARSSAGCGRCRSAALLSS